MTCVGSWVAKVSMKVSTVNRTEKTSTLLKRGIIFVFFDELSKQVLAEELEVNTIRFLHANNSSGEKVRTGAVVIIFPDQVREFVHIGCLKYKVSLSFQTL